VTNQDLIEYLQRLGHSVEVTQAANGQRFIVVRGYRIPAGGLRGAICDIGIPWGDAVPYVAAPQLHTRPALIPMGQLNTQASPLGAEWQYLSRRLRVTPTPKAILAHIATVLSEV